MARMLKRLAAIVLILTFWTQIPVSAQGALSNQVLQLLSRTNTWIGKQTFQNLRVSEAAIPSDTADRIYADASHNLYWNGSVIGGSGTVNPHNLLSTTHPDTTPAAVARGAIVTGQGVSPTWSELTIGSAGKMLRSDGTDVSWSTDASGLTAIPGAQITGTIAAVSGVNLTNLNATNLASGTVAVARLANITNTQIDAAAAIAYSKLSLTGGIVNADINGSAAIVYSKLSLTTSIVNGDLANSTILFAKWASNSCTNLQVPQYNGASWVCKSLATTDVTGAGTVSSVALSLPAIITVSGSPVTTSGTLTGTLATQSANVVWAGPTTGAASAPTFRALVTADFPLTGVAAGTYPKVTVDTSGRVTAASTTIAAATDIAGTLAIGHGGTGLTSASDDTVMVSSGAAWVAQTLPNCVGPTGVLEYTQATNLFSCITTGGPTHNLLSATHTDTTVTSAVRGSMIVANSTPAWTALVKGSAGQLLIMGAAATDPSWGNAVGGLTASTAGAGTLGSVANPFLSLIVGTAATNNLTVTPAAFAAGVVATVDDPGITTAKLPLVKRGTVAYTSGAISAGTCATAVQTAVTSLASTSTVTASLNAAPQSEWQKGITFYAYPTAGNVNIMVCNPTAGSITPQSATFNFTAEVP